MYVQEKGNRIHFFQYRKIEYNYHNIIGVKTYHDNKI